MAFNHSIRPVTSSVDVKDYDVAIVSAATATVYLPDPTTVPAGSLRHIKKTSATGTVTVQSLGSANIEGAASYSLSAQYKFVSVISDGSQWWIIGAN